MVSEILLIMEEIGLGGRVRFTGENETAVIGASLTAMDAYVKQVVKE